MRNPKEPKGKIPDYYFVVIWKGNSFLSKAHYKSNRLSSREEPETLPSLVFASQFDLIAIECRELRERGREREPAGSDAVKCVYIVEESAL